MRAHKLVTDLTTVKQGKATAVQDHSGKCLTDEREILNRCTEYCSEQRWADTIVEWTGLEFAKSQRSVENRKKWRKLVVKSSVVPQRPPQLRNK